MISNTCNIFPYGRMLSSTSCDIVTAEFALCPTCPSLWMSPCNSFCVVLCCAVLCCAVLCCAVLCCAVLCCAVLCCAVSCCAVSCCAVLCCVVLCCAVLCCNLCCAVQVVCCNLKPAKMRDIMSYGMVRQLSSDGSFHALSTIELGLFSCFEYKSNGVSGVVDGGLCSQGLR
jgi:hypothetical protein